MNHQSIITQEVQPRYADVHAALITRIDHDIGRTIDEI